MMDLTDIDNLITSVSKQDRDANLVIAKWVAHVKQVREEKGWSVEQLAEKASLSPSAIRSMEHSGTMPSLNTIVKVSMALGITNISMDISDDTTRTK